MSIAEVKWRGPVPLREGDALVGRGREIKELVSRCASHDVIEITADSGVGKTSFVDAGGRVSLREAGYHLPPPRRWSELMANDALRDVDRTEDFASILYRLAIGAAEPDLAPKSRPIEDVLYELAGDDRMVVVLDQMEELLRYAPAKAGAVLRLAGETARDSEVPHIVIARSEFKERLKPVEVRRLTVWNMYLQPITHPRALAEIIRGPVDEAGGSIEDAAVERLVGWWQGGRDRSLETTIETAELFGGVGLLHLHSLLWSFRHWGTQNGIDKHITLSDVEAFERSVQRHDDASTDIGTSLLAGAIVSYVAETVRALTAGSTSEQQAWRNGPRLMAARIAPSLSSGGYKVPQSRTSLIAVGLADELSQRGSRRLAEVIRQGGDLAAFAKELPVTGAGAAAGWEKSELLGELIRALDTALDALSSAEANILRPFKVADDPVYELVHDGLGPAIVRWSQEFLERPVATISVITARPGDAMWHNLSPDVFEDPGDLWDAVEVTKAIDRPRATLQSMGWPSNYIGPTGGADRLMISDVTFRGCDFTGAAFVRCHLLRVRFEDCTFKGGVMLRSTLENVSFLPARGRGSELDLLTFVACTATSEGVVFKGLDQTTGLVFDGLLGGTWMFRDSEFRHLVIKAELPTVVALEESRVRHVTIEGPADVQRRETEMLYAEGVDG
jgi:hypothetical protein